MNPNAEEKEVQIEFTYDPSKYDASNQLIIETKKDRTISKETKKTLKETEKNILSKKKKKELQKILDKKQKTANVISYPVYI
ncbi:hypothetical protein Ciccas_000741 [Cichlidogyrus casuarinus]|uniref:Uncharacterized protein n=1 Tax=Cichlidogyrus casuarinus TaxID=1844966 RepID=A0ABD2QM01_9PLAT